ncbi:unnamed protein product [Penicillium pancosmium]
MPKIIHQVDQPTSQPTSQPSPSPSLLFNPEDPLGILTEDYTYEPTSYPPLFGSYPAMPSQPPSSRHSASAHAHTRVLRGDSEISSLDLNLNLNFSSEASQAGPSHSRAQSSHLQARHGSEGNTRPRNRPSPGLHIDLPPYPQPHLTGGTSTRHESEGNTRPRNRPSPGLHIDLPPCPQPLRAEDLQSEAVTSGSTTYQNGHSHLLANQDRRHNDMIQIDDATAILDLLRNTISSEIRPPVYESPENYEDSATIQHWQSRSEPSSYRCSSRPRSQRSSSEHSSTRSRPLLAGDIYGVGYGYGFEGHAGTRNNSTSEFTTTTSLHRTEPSTTFFEDTLFELRSSSPIYARESSTLSTRPDIHNSMAPFQGVDPDFAQYQAAELARQVEQTQTQMPGQTESSPSLSDLSSVISFDSREYEL